MAKVKLTYFKPSGKYYSEGEFDYPDSSPVYDLPDQVLAMHAESRLPGLTGQWDGHVHIDPNDHPHAYPFLVEVHR